MHQQGSQVLAAAFGDAEEHGALAADLDVQYKTAFVLMHKLREVMAAETRDMRLTGYTVRNRLGVVRLGIVYRFGE